MLSYVHNGWFSNILHQGPKSYVKFQICYASSVKKTFYYIDKIKQVFKYQNIIMLLLKHLDFMKMFLCIKILPTIHFQYIYYSNFKISLNYITSHRSVTTLLFYFTLVNVKLWIFLPMTNDVQHITQFVLPRQKRLTNESRAGAQSAWHVLELS